ncbi:unnamed protein product [Bursaphelenchus xylophilus]|uniref:(pine wood nematode) hypothetical protein n=1 Tax=Bursaphelenchus xylophilus TaxID=6326 RepID=A0A1I7RIL5_BURXY|nr:unnamed protein product [Bursaphelenchus xylophilus]CAG9118880.1 unnamed protein product [Bursaphelenchus xylophilus]
MSGYFNSGYNNNGRSFENRPYDQQQYPPATDEDWRSPNELNMADTYAQQPGQSWRNDSYGNNSGSVNEGNGRDWRSKDSQPDYSRPPPRFDDREQQNWRSYDSSTTSRNSQNDDDRDWRRNDYNDRRGPRDDRDRDYRDRSPRDDRDSWRRRDSRDRNYRRTPPRRSRSPPRREGRDANATNKIMLTTVPEAIDRDEMNIIISQHGFCPIDVRIIHKPTDTGTRSFGFIEFSTIDQAKEYMKYNNGFLKFPNNFNCRLEYAREPHAPDNSRLGNTAGGPADWNCSKCGINNFNRRENCFKCGINKRDSDDLEAKGYSMVGSEPCDTLLVRELPATANELGIIQAFSLYSSIPIQRVHLGASKRYCLMQMRSIDEASYFLQAFNRIVPQINNCVVIVSYSRVSLNKVLMADSVEQIKSQTGVSTSQVQKDPTNSAAMLAYNAIQMSKMGRAPNPNDRQTISTPLGVFPIYPKPDPRVLQLEPTTGYFYEPNTGFYYDPKTDYYYDPVTCQWCFWTTEFTTFIPCNGENPEIRMRLQQNEKNLREKEAQPEPTKTEDSFLNSPKVFDFDLIPPPSMSPRSCQSVTQHFLEESARRTRILSTNQRFQIFGISDEAPSKKWSGKSLAESLSTQEDDQKAQTTNVYNPIVRNLLKNAGSTPFERRKSGLNETFFSIHQLDTTYSPNFYAVNGVFNDTADQGESFKEAESLVDEKNPDFYIKNEEKVMDKVKNDQKMKKDVENLKNIEGEDSVENSQLKGNRSESKFDGNNNENSKRFEENDFSGNLNVTNSLLNYTEMEEECENIRNELEKPSKPLADQGFQGLAEDFTEDCPTPKLFRKITPKALFEAAKDDKENDHENQQRF